MILAGDVGGTKTNIALFEPGGGALRAVRRSTYRSREHPGLLPIVTDFLGVRAAEVTGACFGIAGPVLENKVRTPNLPWEIDGDEIARSLGIPFLRLVNDLRATAEGVPALGPEDVTVLNEGEPNRGGASALIAAGTGLGMAYMTEADEQMVPRPSEGGHQTFSPRTDRELKLREFLHRRFGHVSVERVVSGPGLANIYHHLCESEDARPDPKVAERIRNDDPPAVIGPAALAGECPVCVEALDIFLEAYGAAAGNLALVTLARDGLWVGGGIAPRLLPRIADGTFLRGFLDKGRFGPLLETIPVRLIENPQTAVLGAARYVQRRLWR